MTMKSLLTTGNNTRSALVVGADASEHELFMQCADATPFELQIQLVENESQALDLLKTGPLQSDWLPPDLILLNARLTGHHSQECVRRIRQETSFKRTPKVVLLDPDHTGSLVGYYLAGSNCCVTKPAHPVERSRVIKGIFQFWLNFVRLPDPVRAQT